MVYEHEELPACETVNVFPPTVMLAVRGSVLVLGAT
jgi:hypothetical protein